MFVVCKADILSLVLAAQQAPGGGGPADFFRQLWIPLGLMAILFYFMVIRPERNRRSESERMLGNLKKNDRVVTIGGICGTIVNAPKDADEITIKVDESTNARLRILRSAVSRVVGAEDQGGEKKELS